MNDDLHDLDELLAAYLDGEATAAERARVDADPALGAEVERLRRLAAALHDVAPPRPAAREAAIAAALATFDSELVAPSGSQPAPATPTPATAPSAAAPPSDVVQLDQRRRRNRWNAGLGVAAAALAVVGVGVIVSQRDAQAPVADGNIALATIAAAAPPAEAPDEPAADSGAPVDPATQPSRAAGPAAAGTTDSGGDAEVSPITAAARQAEAPAAPPPAPGAADSPLVLSASPADTADNAVVDAGILADAEMLDDVAAATEAAETDGAAAVGRELAGSSTAAAPLVSIAPGDDLAALVDDPALFPAGVGDLTDVDRACRAAAGLGPRAPGTGIPVISTPPATSTAPGRVATSQPGTTAPRGTVVPAADVTTTGAGETPVPLADAVYTTPDGTVVEVYLALDDTGTAVMLHATACALLAVGPPPAG